MIDLNIIEPFLCNYINDIKLNRVELTAPAFKFRSDATGLLSFNDYILLKNALFLRSNMTLTNISSYKDGVLTVEFNIKLLKISVADNNIKAVATITFKEDKINTIDMRYDKTHTQYNYLQSLICEILNQDAYQLTGT